jgi:hypothetical protein
LKQNSCVIVVLLIGLLSFTSVNAQRLTLKKSTLSSSTSFVENSSERISINQIIGQTSLIGISNSNGLQISQGFLQPLSYDARAVQSWDFIIFPNPSKGQVQLKYSLTNTNSVKIYVYSTNGKLVMSTSVTGDNPILDLREFSKGVYYLKARNIAHKIILE